MYDILVVDADTERRMRLKCATASVSLFRDVSLCKDFTVAISKLNSSEDRVVIFIGKNDSQTKIAEFIAKARKTTGGQDSTFIQLLDSQTSGSAIAGKVLEGVDSVLAEPFSVDALVEVTNLARVIHGKNKKARQEAAVEQIIKTVLYQLDSVSTSKKIGRSPGEIIRELKKTSDVIKGFDEAIYPYYIKKLIENSENSQIPYELVMFLQKQEEDRIKQEEIAAQKMQQDEFRKTTASKRVAAGVRIVKR